MALDAREDEVASLNLEVVAVYEAGWLPEGGGIVALRAVSESPVVLAAVAVRALARLCGLGGPTVAVDAHEV